MSSLPKPFDRVRYLAPGRCCSRHLCTVTVSDAPHVRCTPDRARPSLQPPIAIAVKLLLEGHTAAAEAVPVYLLGALIGGACVGLALRSVHVPHQSGRGVPMVLRGISGAEPNAKDKRKQGL